MSEEKKSDEFSDNLLHQYILSIFRRESGDKVSSFIVFDCVNGFISRVAIKYRNFRELPYDTINILALREAIDTGFVPDNILDDIREFSIRSL